MKMKVETVINKHGQKVSLKYDYMYMGQGVTYMHFKHKDTREYIKIPKCGVAFNETV